MTEDILTDTTAASPAARQIKFDPEATYLLSGGVGGLGKPIAIWLAERGVKNMTFLSRSAGKSEESKKLFQEIESMGCAVTAVAGSVDDARDVERAITASKSTIKGVFQLAMVLKVSEPYSTLPLLGLRHKNSRTTTLIRLPRMRR